MKTAELTGAALALWVARVLKLPDARIHDDECLHTYEDGGWTAFAPHEDWTQGGPLIEQHHITIDWNTCNDDDPGYDPEPWMSVINGGVVYYGPTPLIAAMRAMVASVYGDEVAA